jgi:nucleoside 2-deoxyribosyltransferase
MRLPQVYLAGPEVFLPDADVIAAAKRRLCAEHGFVGLSPVDNAVDLSGLAKRDAALRISAANEAMIRRSYLLIANLTPFRGPSADVGTAYELGFARALGLPVFGYSNAAGSLLDRTRQALGTEVGRRPSGQFEDSDHMLIEDFDGADNLMLIGAIEVGGTPVVVNEMPPERRFSDLKGFETCLRLAARNLATDPGQAGVRAR